MSTLLYSHTVFDTLSTALSTAGESVVLTDYRGRTCSGNALADAIDQIALTMKRKGVAQGDRVLFLAKPSIESIAHFFALTRVGAVVILADPEMGSENFTSRVTFSKAQWMVQDPILEKIERYSFIKPILRAAGIWFPDTLPFEKEKRITLAPLSSYSKEKISFEEERIPDTDDMAIIFTSGTTGTPKGVVHSYGSLGAGIRMIVENVPITFLDTVYASQLYFLLLALTIPARTYIPKQKAFSAKRFMRDVQKFSITSTFLLPYEGQKIYEECARTQTMLPSTLRTMFFGSAPVTKEFLHRFSSVCNSDVSVYGAYGATEMLIISMIRMSEKVSYTGDGDLLGKPLTGVTVTTAVDKELLVRGPQMYKRYLGEDAADYFYSGDLGVVAPDGTLILHGRKKDMIIRKGYNIYPGIFESTIRSVPGVIDCALVGIYDKTVEDERIGLFVKTDGMLSEDTIKKYLTNGAYSIDSYALPDTILIVNELPYAGRSKKVDKTRLKTMLAQYHA